MDSSKPQGDLQNEPTAASQADAVKGEAEHGLQVEPASGSAVQGDAQADAELADAEAVELISGEPAEPISDKPKHRLNFELDNKDPEYKNGKEKVYDFLHDKLHLTVKAMDIVIAILVIALIVFLVIGIAKGDGGYIA